VTLTPEALRIHQSAIVIDGHNDLPYRVREQADSSFERLDIDQPQPQLHTDIPRLRRGGVGAQFWAAYVPCEMIKGGAARYAIEQIDLIHRMIARYADTFELALTADDIVRIRRGGRIASLIGVEGGHAIENSLGVVRAFHALGARYLTLTHGDTIDWADAATDAARHGGLSGFGEQVVREMNRLGMLVDISHVSADTMRHALRVSRAPLIASHSGAYGVAAHPRNVPDDVLRSVAKNGGAVMVNFYSGFIEPRAARIMQSVFDVMREMRAKYPDEQELAQARDAWRRENPIPSGNVGTLVDHIDHVAKVAGIDHVGLGSDYDGVMQLPEGLEDVSCYPNITQELLNRGYSEGDTRKVLGENLLRVMDEAHENAVG
jgi:membrane dipeptidase